MLFFKAMARKLYFRTRRSALAAWMLSLLVWLLLASCYLWLDEPAIAGSDWMGDLRATSIVKAEGRQQLFFNSLLLSG